MMRTSSPEIASRVMRVRNRHGGCFALLLIIACSLQQLRAADRLISAPCDRVWSASTPTFLAKQLIPESSDRAGGFMKLRWTGGDIGVRTNSFVTLLTNHHVGVLELFDRLRVAGGAFTAIAAGASCQVTLNFEYQGLKTHDLIRHGWFELPTNGHFENTLLSSIENIATSSSATVQETTEVPVAANGEHPKSVPVSDVPKGIIVRFTSKPPDAEVIIDGEYWGATPTADLTRMAAGPHTIVVRKLGYQPWERKITLAPGDDRTISAELEAQPNDPTKPRIVGN
jgi:hypothetical protein